jgi:uncharacterized protein (DUF302 family)
MIPRLIAIVFSLLLMTVASASSMPTIDVGMTVVKVPIAPMSMDEAAKYLKTEAEKHGIPEIAHNYLHKEYKAQGLSNIRRIEIFQFCDAKLAKAWIEHDMNIAAYLPCRVGLIEDEQNKGWFVMINPEIFKASMATMPPDLLKQAKVCSTLMKIIGASPAAMPANMPSMAQTVVKMPIVEDVDIDEAIDSLLLRANDLNVKKVVHINLTDEYKALGLPNIRRTEIFQFCDARLSQKLLRHEIGYLVYMPCRITLVEDNEGKGWFVMRNMDRLIPVHLHKLHKQAVSFTGKLMEIIEAGANGDL